MQGARGVFVRKYQVTGPRKVDLQVLWHPEKDLIGIREMDSDFGFWMSTPQAAELAAKINEAVGKNLESQADAHFAKPEPPEPPPPPGRLIFDIRSPEE